jgi:hypothetical protein
MQIFIMHFDEINGNVPLLFFPDESTQNNEKFMNFFKYHSIWFLDSEDKTNDKYISLNYKGKIYLARVYRISSNFGRNGSFPLENSSDTIMVTVVVPIELVSYGFDFLNVITELFFKDYKELLYYIFLSEILQEKGVKTPKMRKIIEAGTHLKERLRKSIKHNQEKFFSLILTHQQNH